MAAYTIHCGGDLLIPLVPADIALSNSFVGVSHAARSQLALSQHAA
jgi:hypothetical protein